LSGDSTNLSVKELYKQGNTRKEESGLTCRIEAVTLKLNQGVLHLPRIGNASGWNAPLQGLYLSAIIFIEQGPPAVFRCKPSLFLHKLQNSFFFIGKHVKQIRSGRNIFQIDAEGFYAFE